MHEHDEWSKLETIQKISPDWKVKKLNQFSNKEKNSFVNGPFGSDLLSSELVEQGVPVVYIRDIKDGRYQRKSTCCVTTEKASSLSACKTSYGDVIITKVGDPPCEAAVYSDQADAVITQDVIRIKTNNRWASYFLVYLLNSDIGRRQIKRIKIEGTRERVSLTDFKSIRFAHPSEEEQQKIAQILSTWDKAIEKLEALISAKQKRKKALMQQLLTGKMRFAGFDGELKWMCFDQILDIEIGGTPSRNNLDYWDTEKVSQNRWLSIRDLKENVIEDTKEYITDFGVKNSNVTLIPTGSIVMSFKLTIGKRAILGKDCYTNEAICSLIPKDLNKVVTEFLIQALDVVDFEKEIDQAVKGKTLNKAKLKRLKIKLPLVEEQQKVASVLSAADKEIEIHQKQLAALKEQKKGLMQQLLTGKKRVKVGE